MNTNIKRLSIKIPKELHDEIKLHARRQMYLSMKEFCLKAIMTAMLEEKNRASKKETRTKDNL